jgi:hypothetical protein
MLDSNPQSTASQFIFYQDDNDATNINVRFGGKDVGLSIATNYRVVYEFKYKHRKK